MTVQPPAPQPPVPQLLVLDCDGVLVDSERLAVRVDQQVLAAYGWELTLDEIVHRFVGRSDAHMLAEVEAHLGRALGPEWDADFGPAYRQSLERDLVAVEGITWALDAIARAGLQTCVASSGSHEKMRFTLGLTSLWDRFDGRIFSAVDVERGKPAPDLFLHAARSMGVEPSACVVVEDSRYGAQAAAAAGMRCLGYAGGLTPPQWLAEQGAQVFTDMHELPGLLGLPHAASANPASAHPTSAHPT